MANLKTSQEINGAPSTASDLIRIARGNNNYSLNLYDINIERINYSSFVYKINNGLLIADKIYQIFNFPTTIVDGYTEIELYVKAINNYYISDVAYWGDMNGFWEFHHYNFQFSHGISPYGSVCFLNSANVIVRSWNKYGGKLYFAKNCVFKELNGNDLQVYGPANYNLQNVIFEGGELGSSNTDTITIRDSHIVNSNLYNAGSSGGVAITNCYFENSSPQFKTFGGTSVIYVMHSKFISCSLNIGAGVTINTLFIYGKYPNPVFKFDSQFQSKVVNGYAGMVVCDGFSGYSTVQMKIPYNATNGIEGSWNSSFIELPEYSCVGTFLLEEHPTTTNGTFTIIGVNRGYYNSSHKIKIKPFAHTKLNTYNFTLKTTQATITSTYDILAYHGATAKVGQLKFKNSYVELRMLNYNNSSDTCWHLLMDSPHYD